MSKHIINIAADTSGLDPKIKAAIRQMREYTEGCRKAGGTLEFVDKEMIDLAKEMGNMTSKATTTVGQLKVMNTLLKELEINFNRLTDAEKKGQYGKLLADDINKVRSQVNQLNRELNAVGLGSGRGAFGAIFGGNLAARAAMDGIRMVTSSIKNAVSVNIEFEQSNANLAAVLGTTRSEISLLTSDAIRLGSESLYSAKEVTELQTVLARLGFTADEIQNSTKAVLNLATATGTDLSKAADLAGSALRAFGLDSSEMERVASVLAVSTTKSALNTQKLSVSLGYAASVARQAGFSIEEVVAMLGRLVDTGMPATTAGVSVRNMLLDLSNESSKLSKNLGEPISSLDDFMDALDNLNEKGMNTADVSQLVQKRVTNALTALAGNTDKVRELRDEITDCGDAMNKMAEEQASTLRGSLDKLKNSWESLLISIGDGKTGGAGQILSWLDSVIDRLTEIQRLRGGDTGRLIAAASPEVINDRISDYKRRGLSTDQIISEEISYQGTQTASRDKWQALLDKSISAFNMASMKDELEAAGVKVAGRLRDDILLELENNVAYYESNINMSKAVVGQVSGKVGSSGEGALDILTERENKIDELTKKIEYMNSILSDPSLDANTKRWAKKELEGYKNSLAVLNGYTNGAGSEKGKTSYTTGSLGWMNELMKEYQDNLKKTVYGTDEWASAMQEIKDLQAAINLAQGNGLPKSEGSEVMDPGSLEWLVDLLKKYQENLKKCVYGTEEWHAALQEIKDVQAAINVVQGKGIKTTEDSSDSADDVEASWGKAAKAVGKVGGALSGLENPAARVTGIIGQAIANIAAGYAAAVEKAGATGDAGGPWGWIAFAAAGAATMISSIAAIKSATEYHADGGFVGMNGLKRGTDIVPAMLTPGELVLNQAQQGALANQLQGGWGNLHIEKVIGAEEIRLILTNNNRRRQRSSAITI